MDPIMFSGRPRPIESKEQPSLFGDPQPKKPDRKAPYQASSETSRDAADKVAPKTNRLRETVYLSIVATGMLGATRRELEGLTGIPTQTLCPRLVELEQSGRIRKRYRPNAVFGKQPELERRDGCAVYEITARAGVAA